MLYRLAYVFVLLTGFTGLVYQVTWHKYLSFYLGSHAMAAALVLAVFFLFLSLGYSFLGRNIHRIPLRNKLFLYGLIEAAIGFYAILSPPIFHWLVEIVPPGGQSQASDFALGFLFTSLYIGIPTFLMGTTIPVLTQALSRDFETAHGTHAAVYGLNTLGAVFGALLTGFLLIDIWGLPLTLLNTGILNIAIGLATWLMWKARPDDFAGVVPDTTPTRSAAATNDLPLRASWVALLYAVSFASGFYVFSLENLMIRLAGLIIGSSSHTFAMIVAAFILGIALGSLWVGRRKVTGPRFFLWVQVALLVSSVLLYLLIPVLPEWFARIRVIFAPSYINIPLYWTAVFTVFAAILLVPVALMGMNLPLIFNYLRSRGLFLSQTVGRIYGINTLGSVLGSLVGGYLIFFVLDWSGVFRFNLVLIALTLPFILLLSGIRKPLPLAASGLAIVLVALLPRWQDEAFLPAAALVVRADPTATSIGPALDGLRSGLELKYAYHGPAAHIGVMEQDGEPSLHINGNPNTGRGDWELRAMNALYPLSFVKDPERVFVVGLGGGLSASIFAEHPAIDRVLVSEIAIGAIKALPWFDVQNADFTTQPYFEKVEFVPADAIKVLRSTDERFDIIVSEPNHPWVAGVENLFSVEFLTEVRDRLSDDGVYCQWFPLFVSEPETVLTILNTFRTVFPQVRAFSTGGGTLSILASRQPLEPDLDHIESVIDQYRHRLEPRESVFLDHEMVLATEILNNWMLSRVAQDYPATHTFEFPVVASAAFRAKFAGIGSSFRDVVGERIHEVAPVSDTKSRMLYERLRPKLDREFFNRAQRVLAARGDTAVVSLPRLWYQHTTWFGEQPDWPEADDRAMLAYISGLDDTFPAHLLSDDSDGEAPGLPTEVEPEAPAPGGIAGAAAMSDSPNDEDRELIAAFRLYSVYRELIRAQVPARLDRVIAAVPSDCDDERCANLKRAIVFTAFKGNEQARQLNERDLADPETRALIDELFGQLRQASSNLEGTQG